LEKELRKHTSKSKNDCKGDLTPFLKACNQNKALKKCKFEKDIGINNTGLVQQTVQIVDRSCLALTI